MSPESQLLQLYQQWRALTQAEAAAIQAGDWSQLLEFQNQKKSLQQQIEKAEQAFAASQSRSTSMSHSFHATLHELVLLEKQNAAALAERQQVLQQELRQTEKAGSNLRQIQRAYVTNPASAWQSYS